MMGIAILRGLIGNDVIFNNIAVNGSINALNGFHNFGGKSDKAFAGVTFHNTGTGTGTTVYSEYRINDVVKGGFQFPVMADGSSPMNITATSAGDVNTRREGLAMSIRPEATWIPQMFQCVGVMSGTASYKKGWRKLTATLPSSAGEVAIAHGITTIETVQGKVTDSDGLIVFNNDPDPARQFYIRVNGANLVLGVGSSATKIFGKTVTIYAGEEL